MEQVCKRLKERYAWLVLRRTGRSVVANCSICKEHKAWLLDIGCQPGPWSEPFQVELHDRSYFKEMALFKAQGRVHDHECDPDHACLAKIVTILASRDALRRRASQQ